MTSSAICGENMCARFLDKPTKWYFSDFGRCFGNLDHSTPFLFACFCSCFHFASKHYVNRAISFFHIAPGDVNRAITFCHCIVDVTPPYLAAIELIWPFHHSLLANQNQTMNSFKKILIGFSNFFSSSWSLYVYQKYCNISSHAN
jgi:hypothetical protein